MLAKNFAKQNTLLKASQKSFWGSSASTEGISNAPPVRVAVTGAAGNIAYSILYRIASGEFLGKQ